MGFVSQPKFGLGCFVSLSFVKLRLVLVAIALFALASPVFAVPVAQVILNLPLQGGITQEEMISQAELMASQEISNRFAQDPSLSSLEVTVLGDRNGDVIPIVITSVSRADWQANPSVAAWSNYYRAYALFERHTVQSRTTTAAVSRSTPSSGIPAAQFDQAFDADLLTGQEIQANLNAVD